MQRFPTDKMASEAAAIPVVGQRKRVIAIEDLPDEFVQALEAPYVNPRMAALDHLLDD